MNINKILKEAWEKMCESGLVKLPKEITDWIDANLNEIYSQSLQYQKSGKDKLGASFLIGSVTFKNPYGIDPYKQEGRENPYGEGNQKIEVYLVNGFKYNKNIRNKKPIAIFDYTGQYIALDTTRIYFKSDYRQALFHEFTHAVDPKINKSDELADRGQKYNKKYDVTRSPIEFDAIVQQIISHINPKDKDNIIKWVKQGGVFPDLVDKTNKEVSDFNPVIKTWDKDQLMRFRKILVKYLSQ